MANNIVLILGIALLIAAVVGRVKTPYFEVGADLVRERIFLGVLGSVLVLVFFAGDMSRLFGSLRSLREPPAVFVEPIETASLSPDARYVADKIHRNLAELLSNAGHRVIAPPLSVEKDSPKSNKRKLFRIKLVPEGAELTVQVSLIASDSELIATTELTGPTSELKEIYKILPDAILFGLDVDERTLSKKRTAKLPTKSVEAFAYYLNARRKLNAGDIAAAEKALERSISLDSNFAMAYWSLGTLLSQQGKQAEATKPLELANRIDPDHPKYALTSRAQMADPVPDLMSAVRVAQGQELEQGFQFKKAASAAYEIELMSWTVDSTRFKIRLAEQKSPHGAEVTEFLSDPGVILAVNGGFFDIDDAKRFRAAGALVINGVVRNGKPNRQSCALVGTGDNVRIMWAKDLAPLTSYTFVLQSGPILVEGPNQVGIKRNDYDRLGRMAICTKGGKVIFVAIKGAQGTGLSLYEFASILAAREEDGGVGCELALNLDGGPSTQAAMKRNGVTETVTGLWKVHNAIIVSKK
jgi:tetratricopeptide (TPR) repeat protein